MSEEQYKREGYEEAYGHDGLAHDDEETVEDNESDTSSESSEDEESSEDTGESSQEDESSEDDEEASEAASPEPEDDFLLKPLDDSHPIYGGTSLITTTPPHKSHDADHHEAIKQALEDEHPAAQQHRQRADQDSQE